jgi:imidazole glycerol-phosphate synthase subunit HisH
MKPTIAIVDYGMGNLASVASAFAALDVPTVITQDREALAGADGILLPGVGAFGQAMSNLRTLDLVGPLTELMMDRQRPFLGICLGMQLIAERSVELGEHQGLDWISGTVEAIPASDGHPVPHVGWSEVRFDPADPLFARIDDDACFYFDHSYVLRTDPSNVSASADYGRSLTAVVRSGNLVATQFHPEKSQRAGLKLLRNFSNSIADRMEG